MGKITLGQVQQGMILGESIYHPENKKLLLKQGTRLTNEFIDRLKDMNLADINITDHYTVFLDIRENMEQLLLDCYNSMLNKICSKYPQGNMNDDIMMISSNVQKLIPSICSDKLLQEVCVDMQVVDYEALVRTGVFVSGYSMILGFLLGMSKQEVLNLGMAALIHEVGMCEMSQFIRQKELDPSSISLWQEHPTYGYYMMVEKNIPREIAELIYAHHEKFDGTGFPRNLAGEEIPLGSRIIALCADYEELVRNKNFPHYEAIEYIYGNSGISYDPVVVRTFTHNIPVYPLGSVVKLSTGEIGLVVNIRKNSGPRPIIQVQYNRFFKPLTEPKLLDLGIEKTIFITELISY